MYPISLLGNGWQQAVLLPRSSSLPGIPQGGHRLGNRPCLSPLTFFFFFSFFFLFLSGSSSFFFFFFLWSESEGVSGGTRALGKLGTPGAGVNRGW